MTDLRTFHLEIQTARDMADYDLAGTLNYLAHSVASESGGAYRITVSEDRDVIFTRSGTTDPAAPTEPGES